jgi:hypothetical protein
MSAPQPTFAIRAPHWTAFAVSLVHLDANGGDLQTYPLEEGSIVFGRGPAFGITDQRVSRRHCSIVVDTPTRSITVLPNSTNVSYLIRRSGANTETIPLTPNEPVLCQHGDTLSLLEGCLQFSVRVANELEMFGSADPTEDGDATLVNSIPEVAAAGGAKQPTRRAAAKAPVQHDRAQQRYINALGASGVPTVARGAHSNGAAAAASTDDEMINPVSAPLWCFVVDVGSRTNSSKCALLVLAAAVKCRSSNGDKRDCARM